MTLIGTLILKGWKSPVLLNINILSQPPECVKITWP